MTSKHYFYNHWPPCIAEIIQRLGPNDPKHVSHAEKMLITTYFMSRGSTVEDILPMFQFQPDFDEKVVRYQVEHIFGLRGSPRIPGPSCKRVLSQGLCYATKECVENKVIYPTDFPARTVDLSDGQP